MIDPRRATLSLLVALLALGPALGQNLPTGAERLAPERYRDVPESHWALDAIDRLSILGVLTGYPDETFQGQRPATRYELAVVAARLVDLIGGSLAELALDPLFWEDANRVAELLGRVRRLERVTENAASVESVEALADRVADLERFLNEFLGEERFPAVTPGQWPRASAAETVDPFERSEVSVPAGRRSLDELPIGRDDVPADEIAGETLRRPAEWWAGIATGYPLPATIHFGLRDLWPSFHLRAGAGFDYQGGFGLELLGLYQLPMALDSPVLPYLGGGPALRGGAGGVVGGAMALAGLEVPLGRRLDEPGLVYIELGPEVAYGDGVRVGLVGRVGLGYRF